MIAFWLAARMLTGLTAGMLGAMLAVKLWFLLAAGPGSGRTAESTAVLACMFAVAIGAWIGCRRVYKRISDPLRSPAAPPAPEQREAGR